MFSSHRIGFCYPVNVKVHHRQELFSKNNSNNNEIKMEKKKKEEKYETQNTKHRMKSMIFTVTLIAKKTAYLTISNRNDFGTTISLSSFAIKQPMKLKQRPNEFPKVEMKHVYF